MTLLSTNSNGMFDIMRQIHEGENLNWLCVCLCPSLFPLGGGGMQT